MLQILDSLPPSLAQISSAREGDLAFLTRFLSASIRLSAPIAFAAIGGLISERSGVLNIGLEGMILAGAFAAAAAGFATDNALIGVCAGLILGGLVGLLHAFLCVTLRVDQVVSGVAINLVSIGMTSFWARVIFEGGSAQQVPRLETIGIPVLKQIPLLGPLVFDQDLLIYSLLLLLPILTYILYRTTLGLDLRAVGEYPRAADTAGVKVFAVRYVSVILSGMFSGLGGAYLTVVHVGYFVENMSAGKGFIALAALIFGRWNPFGATGAALLFGASEALQLRIQAFDVDIPYQFLVMLPYVIALLALVGLAGRSTPPAALGVPYVKESTR